MDEALNSDAHHTPLARYRFTFRMVEPLRLPEYAGSLLRGQFGAALRKLACMTGEPDCSACPLLATCPIQPSSKPRRPSITPCNASAGAQPLRHQAPAFGERLIDRGEALQFSMVLIGHAAAQLPLVSLACNAPSKAALGASARAAGSRPSKCRTAPPFKRPSFRSGNTAMRVSRLTRRPSPYRNLAGSIRSPCSFAPHFVCSSRADRYGRKHFLRESSLQTSCAAPACCSEFHAGETRLVRDVSELVREVEALRQRSACTGRTGPFSSRQQREMTLGGVLGEWTLEGDLSRLFPGCGSGNGCM